VWLVSDSKGSAVTDFVLVAFPMLLLFSATVAITLGSYARVVLLDATIEGARYASLADQDLKAGMARTRSLVAASLGQSVSLSIQGSNNQVGGIETVRLTSSLGVRIIPGISFVSASSVATREIEY
jgi:Flp pilus assembly protein TadG